MATRQEWDETIARIRSERDPLRSPLFVRLYDVLLNDGRKFLASYQRSLGEERILDLIHDLLAAWGRPLAITLALSRDSLRCAARS